MNREEFDKLSDGDIIRHEPTGLTFHVQANHGRAGVIVSSSALANNPKEWDLVATARYTMIEEES